MGTRVCGTCEAELKGRIDKKFCNDYCRNIFNSRNKAEARNPHFREINKILRRNWHILEHLLPATEKTVTIHRDQLLSFGFRPSFFTHIVQSKGEAELRCCFNIGYSALDNDHYKLVRLDEEVAAVVTGPYIPSVSAHRLD